MDHNLIEQKIYIMNSLKKYFNINKRKEKKFLWKIIDKFIVNDYPCNWYTFLEFRAISYREEIKEIYIEEYIEKNAIEKIKPYLLKYINWRLYNPNNGIRYLKLRDSWYEQF